jgi:hypothetical protein
MSGTDPDIAALAERLGLRGLRYHSFRRSLQPIPRAAAPEPIPPAAPAGSAAAAMAPAADASPAMAPASRSPPAFPLLQQSFARAAGQPAPRPVPDAARPFLTLRLAIGGGAEMAEA